MSDYAHSEVLVETEWVVQHLNDPKVRIVESDEDVLLYDIGHVPGSIKIDWHTELNDPVVRDYLNILKEEGVYKLGIQKDYYRKTLQKEGLDPERYGPVLFKNFGAAQYLLVNPAIISVKTLHQALQKKGLLKADEKVPAAVEKIFKKSIPSFKTQIHFYGYDGRGNDPTRFDCIYTYNLGLTVFSLIANGVTGQMAAIKNLDQDFSRWEPIGIPIAPLMHLEERKGKLALVIEKSIVDVNSIAFRIVKAYREKWLAAEPGDDHYRHPGPIRFIGRSEEERPITLELNALGRNIG